MTGSLPRSAPAPASTRARRRSIRPRFGYSTEYRNRLYVDALSPFLPEFSCRELIDVGVIASRVLLYTERHRKDAEGIAQLSSEMSELFGRRWRERLSAVFTVGDRWRYGVGERSHTRVFKLRAEVADALNRAFDEPRPRSVLIRTDGREIRRPRGEARHDLAWSRRFGSGLPGIPRFAKVDEPELERAERVFASWRTIAECDAEPDSVLAPGAYHALRQRRRRELSHYTDDEFEPFMTNLVIGRHRTVQDLLELLRAEGSEGRFPQRYEQRNGQPRFSGVGWANLQSAPRSIRNAALAGQWSYDIASCHPTALLTYDTAGDCAALREAVEHKSAFREEIAEHLDVDLETAKTALLIPMFGGRFQWAETPVEKPEWALRRLLGKEGQRRLFEHVRFRAYYRDVNRLFHRLLETHRPGRGHRGQIKNALGQFLPKTARRAQRVAFILQGLESQAMQAMIAVAPSAQVAIHDGIVTAERTDVAELEQAMLEATGIAFRVEESRVTAPDWS